MSNPKRLGRDVQNTRSFSLGQRIADALDDNGDGEITTSYLASCPLAITELATDQRAATGRVRVAWAFIRLVCGVMGVVLPGMAGPASDDSSTEPSAMSCFQVLTFGEHATQEQPECQTLFSGFDNGRLRQRKAIAPVVREHNLWVSGFSTERLITVIRSLQKDSIFEYPYAARRAFPELFLPEEPTSPAPALAPTPVTVAAQPTMASDGRPQKDLLGSLESLYKTGIYSDLTIRSAAKTYSVHRAIVCPRSDFLAGACRSPFKESSDGLIALSDDDPCVIDMMMQYFYLLDYRQSLYTDGLLQSSEQKQAASVSCLLLHAKVYSAAEKYAVDGLKDLAVAKFKAAAAQVWDPSDFLYAASEAYTSTIDTDRGLRDAVLEAFAARKDLLNNDEAKTTVKRLGSLAYDLLVYFHREGKLRLGGWVLVGWGACAAVAFNSSRHDPDGFISVLATHAGDCFGMPAHAEMPPKQSRWRSIARKQSCPRISTLEQSRLRRNALKRMSACAEFCTSKAAHAGVRLGRLSA
ncbi:BTB/POZ domain-containing protein [Colletotrichum acutatum]